MRLDVFADRAYIVGMIVALALSIIVFLVVGAILLADRRNELQRAMLAHGFAAHEARKALRLHDWKGYDEMSAYCREVIERRALVVQRDWTKVASYI